MLRPLFALLCTLMLVNTSSANGSKQPPVSIAFHTESPDLQSKKLSMELDTPQGKRFISKTPFITTNDIEAYLAFPSPHTPDLYGVSFQLNRSAAHRLQQISGEYAGKWILCNINGNVVDMLYIDSQVDGRVITIWRGVDQSMLNACNHLIPRIGESKKEWKKRLKQEKRGKRK